MKQKFLDVNLIKAEWNIFSIISTITGFILAITGIPNNYNIGILVGFIILFIIIYILIFCYYKFFCNHIELKIGKVDLNVKVGNLFKEDGIKVIPVNEYFDTQVDDVLISKNTLNGNYITHYYSCSADLDTIIDSDAHSKECIIDTCQRNIGKTKRYKLGTIIRNGEFFLLAFTHFDKNNRAFLEINDYTACLMNMWNECDIHYGGNTVVLPLLGSGITRFHGYENITDQELLEIMIWTFKVSRIRFQYPAKAKIVLTDRCLDKISLYDVKKRFDS